MPEISLANLSLALGALMVITAVFGLVKTEGAMDWAKNFPRNETAGWTLMLAGMAWFLWVLKSETLADFKNSGCSSKSSSWPLAWVLVFS